MKPIAVIEAPTNLGLTPNEDGTLSGVVRLPEAFKRAHFHERLGADIAGRITPPPYNPQRDETVLVLNADEIHAFSRELASMVGTVLDRGQFPLVLGGDCSILLGNLLALRHRGRYGLMFLDGHSDLYQPVPELPGAVADMDLALALGMGPAVLTAIDGVTPLIHKEDVVAFGYRDLAETAAYGLPAVADVGLNTYSLPTIRHLGLRQATQSALQHLQRQDLAGVWIHLDADVLDDTGMPAVDSRQPGGLQYDELSAVLRMLFATNLIVGMGITIFDPDRDPTGAIARAFVDAIVEGMTRTP
ncbi:MAG: arginase family protein [Herpetosiphonaceae bacterium]|nr:arginase family protein [Herpetosiphonaceae bacterium]